MRATPTSLRAVLVVSMLGLMVTSVGVFRIIDAALAAQAVDRQVEVSLGADARAASDRVSAFLEPAQRSAEVAVELVEGGALGLDQVDITERHFLSVLDATPQIDGIFLGTDDGAFLYVHRETGVARSAFRTKLITVGDDRRTELRWRAADGTILEERLDPTDTYDPRTRPWFEGAASDRAMWTSPYVFFSSRAPGITVSERAEGARAVVGVDVALERISGFLSDLRTTGSSSAVIITEDLEVVAHPSESVVGVVDGEPRVVRLEELEDESSRAALEALRASSGADHVAYVVGGRDHHAAFSEIHDPDLGWLISVQAATGDYLDQVTSSNESIARLLVPFLIVAAALGYVIARAVTRPLTQLADAARSAVDRTEPLDAAPTSRFVEIQETMRALRASYGELDIMVAERTETLAREVAERRDAEVRAVAANETKSSFLADVTHEIRTPLTAIAGYADLLADPDAGLDESARREYASVVRDSAEHLVEMVNDLLDLAKVEAGRLELVESAFLLDDVVESVRSMMAERASAAGLTLQTSVDQVTLVADHRRVRQVLINLVANAIKFTPTGGRVTIDAVETGTGAVRIRVGDTGVGMSEIEVRTAMERFGQVRQDGRPPATGSGIGLPLVQELVAAHGGSMEITSVPGSGTQVSIELPSTPSAAAVEALESVEHAARS